MDWGEALSRAASVAVIVGVVGWLRGRAAKAKHAAAAPPVPQAPAPRWSGLAGGGEFLRWVGAAGDAEERARRERLGTEAERIAGAVRDRQLRERDAVAELRRRCPGFEEPVYAAAWQLGWFQSMW
jgi:hypothetical protein